jgi:hypothetical protein
VGVIVLGFGFLVVVDLSNYASEVESLQERYVLVQVLLILLGIATGLAILNVWAMMLYDWGTRHFTHRGYKRLWFLTMCFGMFVGALLYYVVVYELGGRKLGEN